ncbi:hypothetical protein ACIGCZ_38360 [Streptomyces nigra]|uniref:hypothetical protein n=1 Tax=Streptomyces nigra TaxID=1827580 RepID=UPI0037CCE6F9
MDTTRAKASRASCRRVSAWDAPVCPRAEGGLRLRSEEPVTLYIPPGFPFEVPLVYTRHSRFAGAPHVVWARFPCLYRSTATEWDPTDGRHVRVHHLPAGLVQGCRARRTDPAAWPHLATVMIGHQATRGIAALSPPSATGGGTDVLRRTAMTARTDPTCALADMVEDFFPAEPRTELFQPEPGCSDASLP